MTRQEKQTEKNRKPLWGMVRHSLQVALLLFFLVPAFVAGWGLFGSSLAGDALADQVQTPSQFFWYGTLSSSTIGPVTILDPFCLLQTVAASKTFEPAWLVAALPPLLLYGLIRGRAFCGWVCPVNLVLEVVDWLRGKLPLKPLPERGLPRHTKLWVALGVLVLSALVSMPVYEIFNPISFINKGLVFGSVAGGVSLVAILLVELFWGHRVWCRSLCPLGGFYEVLGKLGLVKVAIKHDACIACGKCKRACIASPEILEPALEGTCNAVCAGDCMLCGKCVDACPTKALSVKLAPKR